jgi:hypothetical protein
MALEIQSLAWDRQQIVAVLLIWRIMYDDNTIEPYFKSYWPFSLRKFIKKCVRIYTQNLLDFKWESQGILFKKMKVCGEAGWRNFLMCKTKE